ncbi:MAG: beta-ketoacyl synthase N-terminal-like domain-containing protein, partial [Verrucomicrobiota bacterium]
MWNLLEETGHTRGMMQKRYRSSVGVFAGVMYQHYQAYGSAFSAIANRVSYFFDFQGPSLAVDTMCSSSAVAIHMARESLLKGECELAIAGGVNLSIRPEKYIGLRAAGMIGSHPGSRSFSEGDGMLPAEGVGAVLIKPLDRAVEDGDSILAVIKSTAVNHGGQGNGFSVPNPTAQTRLIQEHFEQSGIDPRTISYVEAAANGSPLGDAIEFRALSDAFRASTPDRNFCPIGSVKSNIGHAEAASGISQLTKVVLQMQHRRLVPTIQAEPRNPELNFDDSPFFLEETGGPWERPVVDDKEAPRRAAISSFGAGGTNAHLLVEEWSAEVDQRPEPASGPRLLVLSARTDERLNVLAKN